MLLHQIINAPVPALIHMERYVNKGSPSGFTSKYTTSAKYDPRLGSSNFQLPYYIFPPNTIEVFGDYQIANIKFFETIQDGIPFFVHPDMVDIFSNQFKLDDFSPEKIRGEITVVPTANGRTVLSLDSSFPFYIKLHYEGCLGRVSRGLPRKKAIAGPEVFSDLALCIEHQLQPNQFAVLPEFLALIKSCPSERIPEIGLVIRGITPLPSIPGRYLIPFFSLFSKDEKSPADDYLLTQILQRSASPEQTLLDKIIVPILRCYTFLVFERGLVPEINAQNILLELDDEAIPTRIVHRDLQGFEKDITIRQRNALPIAFHSAPYKCIDLKENHDLYFKRHSFSYDFKLSQYIFDELLDVAQIDFGISTARFQEDIRDAFHTFTEGEPEHFRPIDKWYAHEKVLLTGERPYIELDNPKYRSIS
jgi:hypothetical protein